MRFSVTSYSEENTFACTLALSKRKRVLLQPSSAASILIFFIICECLEGLFSDSPKTDIINVHSGLFCKKLFM